MTAWEALLWGLLGSGVAEALNLSAMMRPIGTSRRWRRPWSNRADRPWVAAAVGLRLFVGGALAAALGASDQLPTPLGAFLAGLAAPLIVAKLFAALPTTDARAESVPIQSMTTAMGPRHTSDGSPGTGGRTGIADGSAESGEVPDATS